MNNLSVTMLASLAGPRSTEGKSVVIIDVLRASTTIITALANGASAVVPCLHVDEAILRAKDGQSDDPHPLLGGERGGKIIAGFDLGNSPSEYTAEAIAGRRIYFTTTNGTRAMMRCTQANRVVIGAFVNLSATCRAIANDSQVQLLCAGTDDEITREDVLLAGAVVDGLLKLNPDRYELNDSARLAAAAWRYACQNGVTTERLAEVLRDTLGGRNLIEIGQTSDLRAAAQTDRFDVVPELDISSWTVRLP